MKKFLIVAVAALSFNVTAREIGEVSTTFKMIGPNHKIVVEAFNDPKVEGVTCFLSRAKAGGLSGAVGLAEDPSEASVACRQVGPITLKGNLNSSPEEVFKERTSIVFKSVQVVRFYDKETNALIYLVYSDKVIDGSAKNSITAVPIQTFFQPTKE